DSRGCKSSADVAELGKEIAGLREHVAELLLREVPPESADRLAVRRGEDSIELCRGDRERLGQLPRDRRRVVGERLVAQLDDPLSPAPRRLDVAAPRPGRPPRLGDVWKLRDPLRLDPE